MLIKINSVLMIFIGLYFFTNNELLATSSNLFDGYDQKYNNLNDSPEEERRKMKLRILNVNKGLNTAADDITKNNKDNKKLIDKSETLTIAIAKLCEHLGISHSSNNISACNLTISKDYPGHTFTRSGRITYMVTKASNNGAIWWTPPYKYFDNRNIEVNPPGSGGPYGWYNCRWDLGGKSYRVYFSAGSSSRSWLIHGVKTYNARYTLNRSSGVSTFSQIPREASSRNRGNNCIFDKWVYVRNVGTLSREVNYRSNEYYHRKRRRTTKEKLNIRFNAGDRLSFYFISTEINDGSKFRCAQNESVAFTELKWPNAGIWPYLSTSSLGNEHKPLATGNCGNNGKITFTVKYDI